MKLSVVVGVGLLVAGPAGWSEARQWKDVDGRIIEAEFVSSDGEKVMIRKSGKEYPFPLSRLSPEDRKWVSEQSGGADEPARPATPSSGPASTGLIKNHPVSVNYRGDPKAWADGKLARKVRDEAKFSEPIEAGMPSGFEKCVSQTDQTCLVYVPSSYDGTKPFGLYLHITPGEQGGLPGGYQPILDEKRMIFVSADKTSNNRAHWERVARSMNALATVRSQWKIDPNRTFVGGMSGGGHMSFLTHALYSTEFRGAISHAAQSYPPGMSQRGSHFGPMSESDLRRGRRAQNHWLVIIGENDGRNLPETRLTADQWKKMPVTYRCDEIAGMGHSNASAEVFAKGIDWLESNPENTKASKSTD